MNKVEVFVEKFLNTENLKYCYECGECTATCPVAETLPNLYNPRRLLHKIVLDPERVLKEDEIWLCAGCGQCSEMCPQKIRLPEIFLMMRVMAMEKGYSEGFIRAREIIKREITLPAIIRSGCARGATCVTKSR